MGITLNQALFVFTYDELDYSVFFTPMGNGNLHIKVCKEDVSLPIYSKEKPNDYEWQPSEIVAYDLLKQLID